MPEESIREGAVRQNPLDCEVGDSLPGEIWGAFMHKADADTEHDLFTLFDPTNVDDPLRATHGHLYFRKQSRSGKGDGLAHLWVRSDKRVWEGKDSEGEEKQEYAEPSEEPKGSPS